MGLCSPCPLDQIGVKRTSDICFGKSGKCTKPSEDLRSCTSLIQWGCSFYLMLLHACLRTHHTYTYCMSVCMYNYMGLWLSSSFFISIWVAKQKSLWLLMIQVAKKVTKKHLVNQMTVKWGFTHFPTYIDHYIGQKRDVCLRAFLHLQLALYCCPKGARTT